MRTMPTPFAAILLIGIVAAVAIPVIDQKKALAGRHIGTVESPIEQQGKYRVSALRIRVALSTGEVVVASAPDPIYRAAMPGDSAVILEYRSAVLGRREFLVQSLGGAP